jgi:hypothetical protein
MKHGRPRSLTLQQRIELRRLRGDGATLEVCAAWFKTSRASISRYLAMPIPTADQLRAELANPPPPKKPRKSAQERRIERFWAKVTQVGVRGCCWEWQGYVKPSGHGLTTWRCKPIHAHRLAWILKRGEITQDLCINHKCHNPVCCNPNHMYVGTREQNMADYWGRTRYRVRTQLPTLAVDSVSPTLDTTK